MINSRAKLKPLFLAVLATALWVFNVQPAPVSALSGSDWQAGNIMSDSVFFNASNMNPGQIQHFLNSKVPTCDTNGSQIYSGSTTRAQYAATKGQSPPFTCLKDYAQNTPSMGAEAGLCNAYSGGGKSSAQMIYDISQACGINPSVLLVLLQKEQSLITDDWPWSRQYQAATGFGCPDTAPCDASYGGFFYQVYYAARQFKVYKKNASSFNYRMGRNNTILYNPVASCGSSSVYLQNQATAGLYVYTPYQPNAAALANLYGSGDSCSAYGNRNFWRLYTDWFGPTIDGDSYFAITDTNPNNGLNMWYLVTPTGKYYIPTGEVYNAWGLNKYSFQSISQSYFNSVPDRGTLGRSLKDKYGNLFFMENGQTHYVRHEDYLRLWGATAANAVQSTGLVYALPGGDWLGRFGKDATTGALWLMDGGRKHAIPANSSLAYHWRYTPDQAMTTSSAYLGSLTDAGALSQLTSSTGRTFVVDSGTIGYFENGHTEHAYVNMASAAMHDLHTLSYLPIRKAGVFVVDSSDGKWYMLEGGRKHYVPSIHMALNWGYRSENPPTVLSRTFLDTLNAGDTLTHLIQTTENSVTRKWAVDGSRHLLPAGNVANAWTPAGVTLPTYSAFSVDLLPNGGDATTLIRPQGSPYTYTLDAGTKRYLSLPVIQQAWGSAATPTTVLSPNLTNMITEAAPISVIVQNSGEHYLLMNGTAYEINPTYASSWRANGSTPAIASSTLARFPVASQQLGAFIKVNGTYYAMNDLFATPIANHLDAYGINDSSAVTLPQNYFAVTGDASYLVRSTDAGDSRMWLISQGKKMQLPSFAQQANYGYISQGVAVTSLTPAALNAIADSSSTPSLLITKPNAGVKLLSFGSALSFPDGPTLLSYISSNNPVLTVSPSVYDRFVLRRAANQLIKDDSGNVYRMESGNKRLVQGDGLVASKYGNVSPSYLEGTTVVSLPSGSPITN